MRSKHAIGIASSRGLATSTDREGAKTAGRTRFAPAPTGYLHLGHVASAIWVWGLAGLTDSRVLLRIEDHDRERCRPAFEEAILDDLAWLGFVADAGPVGQHESTTVYAAALERLRDDGLVYACDCTRSTYAGWATEQGSPWHGPGCPGRCRERDLGDRGALTIRVALGGGTEQWVDLLLGPQGGDPSGTGDLAIRDRHGNWTYGFAVVVDDLRQSISLVVRGEDLAEATPAQIRLGRLLGRPGPATFAHHPLIRKPGGTKLSKADGDTGIHELRAAGQQPTDVIGAAAAAVGLMAQPMSISPGDVGALVRRKLRDTNPESGSRVG